MELPYWLLLESLTVCGREEDEDESDADETEDEDNEEEDDAEDDSSADPKAKKSKDKGKSEDDEDVKGLLSALRAERMQRRAAEKRAKLAEKKIKATGGNDDSKDDKSKDNKVDAEVQRELQESQAKITKLADRLRKKAVDDAILDAAREAGFIDPTDALTDSIRSQVEVDQDEDDPADIEVDTDSAEELVKALAKKKKHLVGEVPDKSRQKSGSKFRKKSGDGDDNSANKALATHYPSLR